MLQLVLARPLTTALAALALLFAVLWGVESFRAAHLKERVETAEARELGAKVQARLSDKVRTITETLHTKETVIREVANDEAAAIRADRAGSDPVDPGLLARWRGGLERVRAASSPSPDDTRTGEPSGPLPPA